MANDQHVKSAASEAGRALAMLAVAKKSVKERKESASHAAKAFWADMTPRQRSLEVKRRGVVRRKNRAKAAMERHISAKRSARAARAARVSTSAK